MSAFSIRKLILATAISLPTLVSAAETTARLDFPVNETIVQKSRVTVDVAQNRTEGRSYIGAFQESESELRLDTPINQLPYELTVTLRRLKVGVELGDNIITFDSDSSKDSPFVNALSRVLNVPVRLKVGDELEVIDAPIEGKRLMNDLKSMGGFNINHLLSELVQQRFALANQPLQVGKSYRQVLRRGADGQTPIEITYRIIEITADEVRATVEGSMPSFDFQTPPALLGLGVVPSSVKVAGSIEGKVVWNRHNALIYRSIINYLYRGDIGERGQTTPFELRMTHHDGTRLP